MAIIEYLKGGAPLVASCWGRDHRTHAMQKGSRISITQTCDNMCLDRCSPWYLMFFSCSKLCHLSSPRNLCWIHRRIQTHFESPNIDGMVPQPSVTGPRASSPFGGLQLHGKFDGTWLFHQPIFWPTFTLQRKKQIVYNFTYIILLKLSGLLRSSMSWWKLNLVSASVLIQTAFFFPCTKSFLSESLLLCDSQLHYIFRCPMLTPAEDLDSGWEWTTQETFGP